jgi:hypothetical protein
MIPSHPQTREDYGFDRVQPDEEGNLVGLYTGLIKIMGSSQTSCIGGRRRGFLWTRSRRSMRSYRRVIEAFITRGF